MRSAVKVRIYPTVEQARFLDAQFGAVRFVWNKALHIKSSQYKRHGTKLSAKHDLKPLLAVAKTSRRYSWLSQYDSTALQQSCINLDRAYANFFNPKLSARYPRFKRKHGKQSSYHCGSVKVGDAWIKVPKCPPIKARVHRELACELKSITLSKSPTGKYYAALLFEDGQTLPEPMRSLAESSVLGLDVGLNHIVITSSGEKTANPRFLKGAADNLRRKQKALSRKRKGSSNRAKARLQVARCHERVANARSDFQHKLSRQLIDENQAVAVETLKVKNMLQNRRLSKAIADASWHSLVVKLEYKANADGKHLIKIDQWYATSKTCSCCGHKLDKLPLHVRSWQCPACRVDHDRDTNAALNIQRQGILRLKAEGLSVSAHRGLCKTGDMPATACEVGSLAL